MARNRRSASIAHEAQLDGRSLDDSKAIIAWHEDEVAALREDAQRREADLRMKNGRLRAERDAALDRLAATAEILRLIAAGPADPQRVFDAVSMSAGRLLGADSVTLWLREGASARRVVAGANIRDSQVHARLQEWAAERRRSGAGPLHRDAPFDIAILDSVVVQVPDAFAPEAEAFAQVIRGAATKWGWRRQLNVPLMRAGRALGAITIFDPGVGPWSDQEVALVQAFADQAVIAIENARLFNELRERDDRRRQELERASAIQQHLLPETIEGWPGLLELAYRFRPAVETSGGLATPATTLRVAGQRLHQDVGAGHFVACALAVVEPPGPLHRTPRLKLSNAAQVPALGLQSS